jgi:hypothetical protein
LLCQYFEIRNSSGVGIHGSARNIHELKVWMNAKEHALNVHAVLGIDVLANECPHLSGIHSRAPRVAA